MPLLEDVSTEVRISFMKDIANVIARIIDTSDTKHVSIEDVIYEVADTLSMSPRQVHYGINYGLREDKFRLTDHGTVLAAA